MNRLLVVVGLMVLVFLTTGPGKSSSSVGGGQELSEGQRFPSMMVDSVVTRDLVYVHAPDFSRDDNRGGIVLPLDIHLRVKIQKSNNNKSNDSMTTTMMMIYVKRVAIRIGETVLDVGVEENDDSEVDGSSSSSSSASYFVYGERNSNLPVFMEGLFPLTRVGITTSPDNFLKTHHHHHEEKGGGGGFVVYTIHFSEKEYMTITTTNDDGGIVSIDLQNLNVSRFAHGGGIYFGALGKKDTKLAYKQEDEEHHHHLQGLLRSPISLQVDSIPDEWMVSKDEPTLFQRSLVVTSSHSGTQGISSQVIATE